MILAIETASSCGSVSLTKGYGQSFHFLAECSSQPDITHSRRLFGSIDWMMTSSGIGWDALDAVAVSLGPGSFTGLRIGMAAAKSIAMAADKPMIGVPTLDALALNVTGCNRLLGCLLDARKQQVYAGFYREDAGGMPRSTGDPVAISPDKLLAELEEPVLLIGPGAGVYRDILLENELVKIAPSYLSTARASQVGQLAGEMLADGRTLDPATAVPVYIRASEAEVNLKQKQKPKRQGQIS